MKLNKLLSFVLLIVFLTVSFSFLKHRSFINKHNSSLLQVTTSIYPLYYFASQIGGEKVSVVNITPAGAEPHDYELTSQDMIRILSSDLVLLNGSLEPWADKVSAVTIGDSLMSQTFLNEDSKSVTDPHIWLSPVIAQQIVDKITEQFIALDPNNQDYYHQNSLTLKNNLDKLDSDYKKSLKHCVRRQFITSHAAFGYLATQYQLEQVPIAGLSPDSEPSLRELASIADFAKRNRIQYIFFESLVSPKLSETIAKEVGAKTLVLNPLEGLSAEEIKQGKNYFTEMESNLHGLKLALQCI